MIIIYTKIYSIQGWDGKTLTLIPAILGFTYATLLEIQLKFKILVHESPALDVFNLLFRMKILQVKTSQVVQQLKRSPQKVIKHQHLKAFHPLLWLRCNAACLFILHCVQRYYQFVLLLSSIHDFCIQSCYAFQLNGLCLLNRDTRSSDKFFVFIMVHPRWRSRFGAIT